MEDANDYKVQLNLDVRKLIIVKIDDAELYLTAEEAKSLYEKLGVAIFSRDG